MNLNDFKNEIRELRKEEQLQLQKLESIKKNETKSMNLMNNDTISMINDFQSKLSELSQHYSRTNMTNFDNDRKFISEHNVISYDQTEMDIFNILSSYLENLEKYDFEYEILNNYDHSVQKSLYLLYETEMSNVDLEAELAAVEAQIQYLSNQNPHRKPLKTTKDCDKEINDISRQMSDSMREICNNRLLLKLKPDVDRIVQSQTDLAQYIQQILQQFHQQRDRQIQRLNALGNESEIHEQVQNIFDSVAKLAEGFQKLNIQLENVTEIIDSMDQPQLSPNEQILIRMRNHFEETGKEFLPIFESPASVKEAFTNEQIKHSKLLDDLKCFIESSFSKLYRIRDFSENFIDLIEHDICNQWNDKITFINKKNSDSLSCIDPNRLSNRMKEIKDKLKSIKVDMTVG